MPKHAEKRRKWIKALQLEDHVRGVYYVCSEHFEKKDFRQDNFLHDWAVPQLNLSSMKPHTTVNQGAFSESSCKNTSFVEGFFMNSAMNKSIDAGKSDEMGSEFDEIIMGIETDHEEDNNELIVTHQATQTSQRMTDQCLQVNMAYDELIKPWTILDIIRNESDLQSWTGIQRFVTLENIVKCLLRLESAQYQLSRFKISPKVLTVFVMVKLKTNLSFKQLSCLFSLAPETLRRYFEKFIPMLKAVLEPSIFWPTKEQVFNNLPKCFKQDFEDCYAIMDCTESPIERLKSLESKIKTYSHYKGNIN